MIKKYIRQYHTKHRNIKESISKYSISNWKLPITVVGILIPFIIGWFQMCSTEKIALNERKMKMWEIFSKENFLSAGYTDTTVWKTESSIKLLGAMLSDSTMTILEDKSESKLVRAVFEQNIITAINQFHRTENVRLSSARIIASMYHIDKKFVIKKLIDAIKPETYPGYFYINGAVVVALARIPDYWEGTKEQYQKVEQLRNYKFLGDTNITKDYKNGWLNNEALRKWKEVY